MSRPAPRGGRMPADPRASSHVVRCRGRARPPTWGPERTYRRPSPSTSQTVRARPVRPVPPAPLVPRVGTPRSRAPQPGPVSARASCGSQVEEDELAHCGRGVELDGKEFVGGEGAHEGAGPALVTDALVALGATAVPEQPLRMVQATA